MRDVSENHEQYMMLPSLVNLTNGQRSVGAVVKDGPIYFEKSGFNLVIKNINTPSLQLQDDSSMGHEWSSPILPDGLAVLLAELRERVLGDVRLEGVIFDWSHTLTAPGGNLWVLGGDDVRYSTGSSESTSIGLVVARLEAEGVGLPAHGLEYGRLPFDPEKTLVYKTEFMNHIHAVFDPSIEYGLLSPDPAEVKLAYGFDKRVLPILRQERFAKRLRKSSPMVTPPAKRGR